VPLGSPETGSAHPLKLKPGKSSEFADGSMSLARARTGRMPPRERFNLLTPLEIFLAGELSSCRVCSFGDGLVYTPPASVETHVKHRPLLRVFAQAVCAPKHCRSPAAW
jgi:hypothetical protein